MFSKEESKKTRQDFWIAFGKSFPKKWLLYDTKIKGVALKFSFGLKSAMVSIDIEPRELSKRIELWEKLLALKSILLSEYAKEAQFEDSFLLENNKEISRIYIMKQNVSIHNKQSWRETMEFFNTEMTNLECFFLDYKEYLEYN
ncbi:DUF4268 domain-containing protein [Eudoraea sp.]|uniref:DUF4268 domain-containing protein n=1 Tax=Eudoraea sp. TaxID=1979955 RepID=UPI003C74EB86